MREQSYEALLFDMDNTLFDELTYFKQAFREIATAVAGEIGGDAEEIYRQIIEEFEEKGSQYDKFFLHVARMFDLHDEFHDQFYETYLTVDADLKLYDDADQILQWSRDTGYRLGIVTSGSIRAQRNKIEKLELEDRFEELCIPRELGDEHEKPSAEPYRHVANQLGVDSAKSMYIGDNPLTDFQGAKELDMTTVRLQRGEFEGRTENEHLIDHEIDTHDELRERILSSG